mgnify:CR=1 FL=1
MNKYQRVIYMGICKLFLLLTPDKSNIKVLSQKETPEYVKKHNKSLIRLGDGEFRIMLKKRGIEYQRYSPELREDMLRFMNDYKFADDCGFVLAVPNEPFIKEASWFKTVDDMITQCFAPYRFYFRKCMNNKKIYGDAFVFQQDNETYYSKLWENSDYVIFLHHDERYARLFERKYKKKTVFIKVPSENSYEEIEKIEQNVINAVNNIVSGASYSILISCGPAAKVLVYKLLKKGIVSYDTGHCWDEPLEMPNKGE